MRNSEIIKTLDGSEIAIIGLAGRFPGARNIDEFWENLHNGVESITFLSDEEIDQSGVDDASITAPNYVKAAALLEGAELFDASFFGYTPREAEVMDPQHRVFLECAWEALENAGYDAESYNGAIGVFAGARTDTYLFNLLSSRDALSTTGAFEIGLGNDLAFLSSRASYKLNLKGPSFSVHTACSTSLVAVHLACQSLLIDECQMALAGGVAVNVPQKCGYLCFQGGYASPDGKTRAFDENAQGTIFGSGVGIVVLKRLADALEDGDTIHAVIKGSAINNDGAFKANYLAPSIHGQAQAISVALACAGVKADSIGYVEAHGTGTAIGDPIEIRALTKAFRSTTDKNGFCAIGSVKSNVGHLDAAAGVTSLIKATLALKHKLIPPSLNFQRPNPKIDFLNSPFFVADKLTPWPSSSSPLRAGVSSFGVGGTNAHLILEEVPPVEPSSPSRPFLLLPISAKTDSALEAATDNLRAYLRKNPEANLADVAYTLSLGRRAFSHRRFVVCRELEEAASALEGSDTQRVFTGLRQSDDRPVIFMFPGGGSQYVNMAHGLFLNEPFFRRQLLSCFDILHSLVSFDLSSLLFPSGPISDHHSRLLSSTSVALPALFCVEYSLARLWMRWGIRPQAMIGHSLGEYVAACLSGVFSLEDALSLVVTRGRLFEQLPSGAMLSVPLSESELSPLLSDDLSIAANNGPNLSVVSGPRQSVEQMAETLKSLNLDYRILHINGAGHSAMVEPILEGFSKITSKLTLNPPSIPYISNLTGAWVTDEQAADPNYWVEHLRRTVRFGDGIRELMKERNPIFLEIGPGQTLSTLVKLQSEKKQGQTVISSIRHPSEQVPDEAFLMTALGKLWLAGMAISWDKFYENEQRQRIALPSYPFQRQRYWVDPKRGSERGDFGLSRSGKRADISEWFYIPSWKMTKPAWQIADEPNMEPGGKWLVFSGEQKIAGSLITRLRKEGQEVVVVKRGGKFGQDEQGAYVINERSIDDYRSLIKEIAQTQGIPNQILHLWSVTGETERNPATERFEPAQYAGCYSILFLAQALTLEAAEQKASVWIVADGLQEIESADQLLPEKATILGPSKVIPQEIGNIRIKCIDVVIPARKKEMTELVNKLLLEATGGQTGGMVAFRGRRRWEQIYEPAPLAKGEAQIRELREKGVYLIIGGLGGVGLLLARYFAEKVKARLVLTSRAELPPRSEWEQWIAARGEEDGSSSKIRRVQELESLGAEVVTAAVDVADQDQMQSLIDLTLNRFGQINGVLYAAGTTSGPSMFRPMVELGPAEFEMQFGPKGHGLYILEKVLRGQAIDFCLLFSSNSSVLGGLGFAAYSAANCFVDAFVTHYNKLTDARWISASWDGWPEETKKIKGVQTSMDQYAMTIEESVEATRRVVCLGPKGHVVVATGDLPARLDLWIKLKPQQTGAEHLSSTHSRPNLQNAYVAPRNEREQIVANTWQELLGISQVGIHDNFFDLGGHSLLATRLVAQLREIFRVDLPLRRLFETPTVQGLAQAITDITDGEADDDKREILEMLTQLSEEEVDREIEKRTRIAATMEE